MNNWLDIIQKNLLPPRCILCEQPGYADMDLCAACFAELPRNTDCCYRCGENFDFIVHSPQLCGRCLTATPNFDDTYAPYLYEGNIRYLVTQLKFARHYKNARLLGNLLASHIEKTAEIPEFIIPMPLHINRYRERQFNQSIEIAREVTKQLRIRMDLHSCLRIRDTPHQTGLAAKERQQNLHKAFSVNSSLKAEHVAILDDVMTTGATASALAKTLKEQGVGKVDVWVCARA